MTSRIQPTISVRHVSISIEKTFGETCSSFESRMGRIDYAGFNKMLCEGESEMAVRDHIKAIEGPLGLMIFNAIDHGILLSLAGKIARPNNTSWEIRSSRFRWLKKIFEWAFMHHFKRCKISVSQAKSLR